jgi:hypothetical protein
VVALLTAPVPLAAAAVLAWLARGLGRAERLVVALGVAAAAAAAVAAPQGPGHDSWVHLEHARAALSDPAALLGLWDRPGFLLYYAAPSALGVTAARLASAVLLGVAIAGTIRAARALALPHPWCAGALLAIQPDVFGQASSTMTELPFAAAFAIAVWAWVEDRPWLVAAGLGWMAITRPEGPVFAALGAVALILRGRARGVGPAALALAPFAAYAATGWAAFGDPRWLATRNPYRGLVSVRLEARQVVESYFFTALRLGQPLAMRVALAAGALVAVAGPARRLRFLLAPLLVSFALLTFLRIGLTDAWRESRYLVAVSPALALLAAAGLDWLLARWPRAAPAALLALGALWGGDVAGYWWWAAGAERQPARALLLAASFALAGGLWLARGRVPARAALVVVLAFPLAAAPPGSWARQRQDFRVEARGGT